VTDPLEKIKQRNAKVRGFNTELDADWDWLISEVERLRGAIEAYFNFAPGGYVMWEKLTNELREKDATIATEAPQ